MSSDRMYNQEFQCNHCNHFSKQYIWESELDTKVIECKECNEGILIPHFEEVVETFMIGTKMTKTQIKADRKKRSSDHFRKEVLPTLDKTEQKFYANKYKK